MTPHPSRGAMEQWIDEQPSCELNICTVEFLLVAREQDAALAELTRQRDELLGEVRMFLSRPFMPGPQGGRHIGITDEQWVQANRVMLRAGGTAVR